MGKCLVTKLENEVNNPNLEIFEAIVFGIDVPTETTEQGYCYIPCAVPASGCTIIAELHGNNKFNNDNRTIVANGQFLLAKIVEEDTLVLKSKYNIIEVGCRIVDSNPRPDVSFDLSQLSFASKLTSLNFSISIKGDTSSLAKLNIKNNITSICLSRSSEMTGTLADFSGFSNLSNLELQNDSLITGSLTDLIPLTKLSGAYLDSVQLSESFMNGLNALGAGQVALGVRQNGETLKVRHLESHNNLLLKTITFDSTAQGGYTIS